MKPLYDRYRYVKRLLTRRDLNNSSFSKKHEKDLPSGLSTDPSTIKSEDIYLMNDNLLFPLADHGSISEVREREIFSEKLPASFIRTPVSSSLDEKLKSSDHTQLEPKELRTTEVFGNKNVTLMKDYIEL